MSPLIFYRAGMAATAGLAGLVPGAAWAQRVPQTPAPTSAAQPFTQPALPNLPYSSVFTHYQRFAAQPVTPWGVVPTAAPTKPQGNRADHSSHGNPGSKP